MKIFGNCQQALALLLGALWIPITGLAQSVLDIQRWTTTQGAEVWYLYSKSIPLVDVRVGFLAGSRFDGEDYGVAHFVASSIGEKTKTQSAEQIADAFDCVGAQFSVNTNHDAAVLSFRTLSDQKYFLPATQNFSEVFQNLDFSPATLSRVKKQTITAIKLENQSASAVANKTFYGLLYKGTPYEYPVLGTLDKVRNMREEALRRFYQQYYVAHNERIVIVGDIALGDAKALAEKLSFHLPTGKRISSKIFLEKSPRAEQSWVDFPSTQTTILMGQVGVSYQDPHWYSLMVGNYVLGGAGLTSLLSEELRQKNGLVYGISTEFRRMALRGPFVLFFQTRAEETHQAFGQAQNLLSDFIQKGPDDIQIKRAKQAITGSFPIGLSSNEQLADALLKMAIYELPVDYLDQFVVRINKVSVKSVKAALEKNVDPKHMVTVFVGKQVQTNEKKST